MVAGQVLYLVMYDFYMQSQAIQLATFVAALLTCKFLCDISSILVNYINMFL